jgi:hypothetical protein
MLIKKEVRIQVFKYLFREVSKALRRPTTYRAH